MELKRDSDMTKPISTIAIHEAGHAVAAIVSAIEMGADPQTVVSDITFAAPGTRLDLDGTKVRAITGGGRVRVPDSVTPTRALAAVALAIVGGPAAQARFEGLECAAKLASPEAVTDRAALERECNQANADLTSTTHAAIERAEALMQRPKMWAAVLAVARLVDGQAETRGVDIVRVALAAMAAEE
jgi:hypothetical protein